MQKGRCLPFPKAALFNMVKKDFLSDPQFNSGLSFIMRLNWLMNLAHTFKIEAETETQKSYIAYLSLLESIHIEIDSHIKEEERTHLDKLKHAARLCLQQNNKDPLGVYHLYLNRYANKSGILMKYEKDIQQLMQESFALEGD